MRGSVASVRSPTNPMAWSERSAAGPTAAGAAPWANSAPIEAASVALEGRSAAGVGSERVDVGDLAAEQLVGQSVTVRGQEQHPVADAALGLVDRHRGPRVLPGLQLVAHAAPGEPCRR